MIHEATSRRCQLDPNDLVCTGVLSLTFAVGAGAAYAAPSPFLVGLAAFSFCSFIFSLEMTFGRR